jgi:ABC-type iron transport system FetAB ATPase subunit
MRTVNRKLLVGRIGQSVNTSGKRSYESRTLPTSDTLIVIAVPSDCGKSTLIKTLRSGDS